MDYTTIQISKDTREELSRIKEGTRGTYDDVIRKMLSLVPSGDEGGEYADDFRVGLLNARLDVIRGDTIPHDAVKRQLGL
jgi:hypothetical protein